MKDLKQELSAAMISSYVFTTIDFKSGLSLSPKNKVFSKKNSQLFNSFDNTTKPPTNQTAFFMPNQSS